MKLNTVKIELELERIGKTKAWLAAQMGAKKQWIHRRLKENNSGCTLKTIEKFGVALGIDPKDLII
jgi:hypothetical protein